MSRNGSGTYSLPSGNPVTAGSVINSTTHNTTMSDIATALTASIAKDGQTTPSANLPMGGYKHTGVAVAAARDQYATAGGVQDGTLTVLGSVTGVDTITATAPVSMSAYAAGQVFSFVAAGANTGAVTLNLNSIGAKAVTRNGVTALVAGDIPSGAVAVVEYDGTQFQLINPASVQDALLKSLAGQTVAANKIQAYSAADTASLLDFKDEDDMASNSATAVASQQSLVAYVATRFPNQAISYTGTGGIATPGAILTTTTTTPAIDNSIPQISEGSACLDVTITPSRAGAVIEVEALLYLTGAGSLHGIASMFVNNTADAVKASLVTIVSASYGITNSLLYRHTAPDTTPITFKVRVGVNGNTLYVNAPSTGATLGGVIHSYIKATEVA